MYPATRCSALLESQRLYRLLLVCSTGRMAEARCRLCHRVRVVIAAAGDIKRLDVSDCGMYEVSVELQQQLHRFPALQHVNISGNPSLGSAGVTAIVSSLAGA
jgi:hypothetical protein